MKFRMLNVILFAFISLAVYSCNDANDSEVNYTKEPLYNNQASDDSLNLLIFDPIMDFGTVPLNVHGILYFSIRNSSKYNGDTVLIYNLDLQGSDSKYFSIKWNGFPLRIYPQKFSNDTTIVSQCPYIAYLDTTPPGDYSCKVMINKNPHYILTVKLKVIS